MNELFRKTKIHLQAKSNKLIKPVVSHHTELSEDIDLPIAHPSELPDINGPPLNNTPWQDGEEF